MAQAIRNFEGITPPVARSTAAYTTTDLPDQTSFYKPGYHGSSCMHIAVIAVASVAGKLFVWLVAHNPSPSSPHFILCPINSDMSYFGYVLKKTIPLL